MADVRRPLHVAIIGGGLCGLALAIALEERNVSYTVYEARASFTEIGAGLNLAPNAIHSFNAIDPRLHEQVFALATRNEPGREEVWMDYRLGAPTNFLEDGQLIGELHAPPTGNMTVSRNELLQLLARSVPKHRAQFNKKLVGITQSPDEITLAFADGTSAAASVAIGCDGVHSTVRAEVLGPGHPAKQPTFSHTGGYRAIFSKETHEQVIGADKAHTSQIYCGPRGYVIMYPISGGNNVNIGVWMAREEAWTAKSWVVKHQKSRMLADLKDWGDSIQRVMNAMSDETEFWATFRHAIHPNHYFNGRACLIGDAAHSMPPHQGQGASQAIEDACVMSTVLQRLNDLDPDSNNSMQIEAAFLAFEAARKDRFEKVAETSHEAHSFWAGIWRPDLKSEDLAEIHHNACDRFEWLWDEDIVGQQHIAVQELGKLLKGTVQQNGESRPT